MNNWISVKDRLPEDDLPNNKKQIKVLVVIKAKNGYTVRSQMRFLNIYNKWAWKYSAGDITHWMPLPEPPKGEKNHE